ncbi:MAG TPA: DUF5677 domain-containing protein [Actinomycetota bacterium]|nr:DUF5677 domain-containing protein [Actinomycetota bacterium]
MSDDEKVATFPEPFQPDFDDLSSASSEHPFMGASVELLKEAGHLTILAGGALPAEHDRDEAILCGLVIRISKLSVALVAETCELRGEQQLTLTRQILEFLSTLNYLLEESSIDAFDAYVKDSLVAEREFLRAVQRAADQRGEEWPIETRMMESIHRTATAANIADVEAIPGRGAIGWPSIEIRLARLGAQTYGAYRMGSHAIHGTWSDLYFNHLQLREDGTFDPDGGHSTPRPQPLTMSTLLITWIVEKYVARRGGVVGEEIIPRLRDLKDRVLRLDILHERFVQARKGQ